MNNFNEKQGIWFVYDGDCPICNYAAESLRIRQVYGQLNTLNARESAADPLLQEIYRQGLDLDEGMVIYANNRFYHGKEALKFMAEYGAVKNAFMCVFKGLFWSDLFARLMYPWMRGVRNWLLRRRHVERIDNLHRKQQPTFKAVFGSSWEALPAVFKKHYANRPYTRDVAEVRGMLDVMCKPPLRWLAPVMKLLGQIPPVNENHVPVTVTFQSDPDSAAFHFNRVFHFSGGKPYAFRSRMLPLGGDVLVEIMRFGLGWKLRYTWDGETVVLSHLGYVWYVWGHFIPLPLAFLMGEGYAEERAIDDTTFEMQTYITHPWWGKVYEYKGRFEVIK